MISMPCMESKNKSRVMFKYKIRVFELILKRKEENNYHRDKNLTICRVQEWFSAKDKSSELFTLNLERLLSALIILTCDDA